MKGPNRLYTIQEISHKLEIPKPTLRFWEKELCGILNPIRTAGGQRRYTHDHFTIIETIKTMQADGMRLAEIRSRLKSQDCREIDPEQAEHIQFLADRIAEVVKDEVYQFLSKAGNG